jgi:hypothetical protein
MKKKTFYLTIMLWLVLLASAHSAYWESSITQVGIISPGPTSDAGRILVKFELPEQLNGALIDYAELMFTATPDTGSGYICILGAFPVTKNWESGVVSWSGGWDNAGGDYTDSMYACSLIRTSPDLITRIDISGIVQSWVDGDLPNYGLIIMPLENPNRFLKLHSTPGFAPNIKAKVRIFYTLNAQ